MILQPLILLGGFNISKLGRRELFFFNITDRNIETVIDEIRSARTSHEYTIDVYSGKYEVNVTIEVSGLDKERIRQVDLIIYQSHGNL